jgi:O-antigen/teichoic acid export membrane protein
MRGNQAGEAATMHSIHRSIFFSAAERYGTLFLFLISIAILSRLLTPAEFGVYALINALTAVVAASFQEFGGANYIIQKQPLTTHNIRTAFTITMCLSVLFAVSLFELRGVAAWFFSDDSLKIGIAVATLNFLLSPFVLTISALLRREMAFGILACCNLIGNLMTAVISIALATLGFSFMAPVLGNLIGTAVLVALLVSCWKDRRIFFPSFVSYRDVIGFGAYSTGTIIINVFYNMAPQFILARVLDFTAVGLYGRATNVTQVFEKFVIQVLNPVIMPALFAKARTGEDLKRLYLDSIELISAVQWPFLIAFALMAEPIIWIWLGPTWIEIVPLIQMLCLASLSLFAACLTYPVLVAVGRVRDTLVSSLISLSPSLLVIFVASFFGVQMVAASALLTLPFQAVVALYFVGRHLAIRPAELVRATLRSGIVTACTIAGALSGITAAKLILHGQLSGLLFGGVFATTAWGLALFLTKHPLLTQVRLAVSAIAAAASRFPILGQWAAAMPAGRKSE